MLQINIYGKERFKLGSLNYTVSAQTSSLSDDVIGGIVGGGSAAVIIMVVVAILLFKRSRYHKQQYQSMVKHVDQIQCNSRHEIMQGEYDSIYISQANICYCETFSISLSLLKCTSWEFRVIFCHIVT